MIVSEFITGLQLPDAPPVLPAAEVDRLAILADVGTRRRSAVVRGGSHSDTIMLVPAPEQTPRLIGSLEISVGLNDRGIDETERWRLLSKCSLDGMQMLRVLHVLLAASLDYVVSTVAGRCGVASELSTSTSRGLDGARCTRTNGKLPRDMGGVAAVTRAVVGDGADGSTNSDRGAVRILLIYAAHPMTLYGTARETRILARIASLAPDATVINPAVRYRDTNHRHQQWPRLVWRLFSRGCLRRPGKHSRHRLPPRAGRRLVEWNSGGHADTKGDVRDLRGLRLIRQSARSAARLGRPSAGRPTQRPRSS